MLMSKKKFKLPQATCNRCDYVWTPRKTDVTMCPKCKSPYWDKARVNNIKAKVNGIEEKIV